jgi:uncharacterized protein YjbI with pentapeptide repeats/beta-lactamase regulating signal transducer with metallopeptidase domain
MPLAGIVVSVSRAYVAAEPATRASSFVAPAVQRSTTRADATGTVPSRATGASVALPNQMLASLDFRFLRFAPRVSRALALGVVGIWLTGVLIGLIGLAGSIVRVRGLKRRSSPLDGALADELPWLTEVTSGREIYLRLSFETETPVAIGFRRPVILIPTELATADGLSAIEQLVLHEHAHLRRYDDWTNLAQRTIERIFWFNPIVWLVGRKIALEREIASDDAVVDKTGEAHAYATSLWKLAREMRMPEHAVVAPGALLTRKQITIRIEQLLDKKRSQLHRSPATAAGVALAGALAIAFVATSAPAVELPAAAAEPVAVVPAKPAPKAAARTWRADRATTRVAKTVNVPAQFTDKAATIPGARPPVPETRIIKIVQMVQAPRGAQALPAKVLVPPPLPAVQPKELAVVPAAPELPPAPPAAVPSFSPETLGKIRAASASAARAHDAVNAAGVGTEVARVLHDVMTSIPREIAQETSSSKSQGARFDGVKLTRDLIAGCVGCSFRHADVRGLDLHGLKITADDFSDADMRGVNLSGSQLFGVSLSGANLANADLRNAQLSGVEFRGANFDGAKFEGVKLFGVAMRHLGMRGTAVRSILGSCTGCDFSKLDLRGQDLHGIVLAGANLSYADLRDANLSSVRFSGVNLSHTNLTGADLSNARFDGCDLTGVDLHGARTTGMTMQGNGNDG